MTGWFVNRIMAAKNGNLPEPLRGLNRCNVTNFKQKIKAMFNGTKGTAKFILVGVIMITTSITIAIIGAMAMGILMILTFYNLITSFF